MTTNTGNKPTKNKSASDKVKPTPVIKDLFPMMLPDGAVNSQSRDLVEHLLTLVIKCNTSPDGPTSDEIRQWVLDEAVKLPEPAFVTCTAALEEVLAQHPEAPVFLDGLIAARKLAERMQPQVFAYEQARTLAAALKLENSVGFYEALGVPGHLVMQLKKHAGKGNWTPPLALCEPQLSHRQKYGWLGLPSGDQTKRIRH